jgi:predicted dehydrogenase
MSLLSPMMAMPAMPAMPAMTPTSSVIRLVVGAEEAVTRQLAARLRGASVETRLGDGSTLPPDTCDAAVYLDLRPEPEVLERLLSRGTHVLVTPCACWSGDALERLSVARRSGTQLAVSSPDRFLPSRQLIRQQLDAGRLGEPGLVRIHRWLHLLDPESEGPHEPLPIAMTQDIDVALWLMGEAPDVVYAVERAGEDRGGRSTQVHLGFPGGGMALIDYSDQLPRGDGYQSLSLIGSAGAAYADDHQNRQLLYRGGRPEAVRVDERGRQFLELVQAFVSDLEQGRDLAASVSTWRTVLAVADAARQSVGLQRALAPGGR